MAVIGFIGTGNMGGAIAAAVSRCPAEKELLLCNRTPAKAEALAAVIGGQVTDNRDAACRAEFLFLGVKPQMLAGVLADLRETLAARKDRFVLVSMVAGTSRERIRELAGGDYPVIRILPNTPAAIGEGMVFYTCGPEITPKEKALFLELLAPAGKLAELEEGLLDAGSAVAGCGPAFVCMFLEALADGGVACGLRRDQALAFAAQMLVGTGRLLQESGKHPGQLKDAVCSPGGATIQGVRALEEDGFRGAVMDAVIAAYEKHLGLSP